MRLVRSSAYSYKVASKQFRLFIIHWLDRTIHPLQVPTHDVRLDFVKIRRWVQTLDLKPNPNPYAGWVRVPAKIHFGSSGSLKLKGGRARPVYFGGSP